MIKISDTHSIFNLIRWLTILSIIITHLMYYFEDFNYLQMFFTTGVLIFIFTLCNVALFDFPNMSKKVNEGHSCYNCDLN